MHEHIIHPQTTTSDLTARSRWPLALGCVLASAIGGWSYLQFTSKLFRSEMGLMASAAQDIEGINADQHLRSRISGLAAQLNRDEGRAILVRNLRYMAKTWYCNTKLAKEVEAAASTPLSRRDLQTAFQQQLGGNALATLASRLSWPALGDILLPEELRNSFQKPPLLVNPVQSSPIIVALRTHLLPKDSTASLEDLRLAAEAAVIEGFSDESIVLNTLALMRELYATPFLLDVNLYHTEEENGREEWDARLREGLRFSTVKDGILYVSFEEWVNSPKDALPAQVLETVARTMQIEFERTSNTLPTLPEMNALETRIAQLQDEIHAMNSLPGGLNADQRETLIRLLKSVKAGLPAAPGWRNVFRADSPAQPSLEQIDALLRQRADLERICAGLRAKTRVLAEYIQHPENQTVTVRVERVAEKNPPEVIPLRSRLLEAERQCRLLLERSTPQHPLVRKLLKEIDELRERIAWIEDNSEIVVESVTETNPRLVDWKRDQSDLLGAIRDNETRQQALLREVVALIQAVREQGAAHEQRSRAERLQTLQSELKQSRARRDQLRETAAKIQSSQGLTMYPPPAAPRTFSAPDVHVVYGIALGIGLAFAGLLLATGRQESVTVHVGDDDHLNSDTAHMLPVLGRVSRF